MNSANLSRNLNILNLLMEFKPILHRLIILHIDANFIKFTIDCIHNVIVGNVGLRSLTETKLKRFQSLISLLSSKKVHLNRKRNILATNQGVRLIKIIGHAVKEHFSQNQ